MRHDDDILLWVLAGIWVLNKLEDPTKRAVKSIEQGGAKVYDWLHPGEREHMNDLPGQAWTKAALMQLAARAGFPDPRVAAAIAMAESGGVPGGLGDMRNGDFTSVGLWQIHLPAWPQFSFEDMKDPEKNAAAAFMISKQGTDWRPWSTWWADPKRRIGPGEGRFRLFL